MTRKPLILLVDDDREIILGLSLRMRAANYEIITARDGKEGLASALETRPDAIILDVRMPVMDGLTMLGELRANEATAAIPVVILSANIASGTKARALELGARYFLQKPYESSKLIQAVQSALGPETPDRAELDMLPMRSGKMENGKSVVIAEDDAELVNALTFHLQKLDFIVRPASDDFDVLAKVLRDWPKLLIIDPGRPSGNGFAVIERILQESKFTQSTEIASLPVIVLTNESDEQTLRECKILGLRYVHKDSHLWAKLKPLIGELVSSRENGIDAAMAAPVSHHRPEPVSSPPKILIVDDDPDIVRAIKIRLECHGVDTVDASNGLQGFQMALNEKPDLIISDYSMPDGGGDHMIVRLKQNAATHDIPIIVLTGWTVGGRKDMALERDMKGRHGVSAFLTKPVDFDVLLDALRRHIILAPFSRPSTAIA